MRHCWLGLLLAVALSSAGGWVSPARAEDRAGAFDHYILALSWNAAWCVAEGDGRGADQCDANGAYGFILHGFWPQHERGWPDYCETEARDPSRAETAAMADIMGSGGLAWYQWKKHGRCSGLDPADYFAVARAAWENVRRPAVLREVEKRLRLDPGVVEAAFLEANPALEADGVTVTCRGGFFREVRICLTKELEPRPCTGRARIDCESASVIFVPMR